MSNDASPPTKRRRPTKPSRPQSPFVVAVDTREQKPYSFAHITSDASDGSKPLLVRCETCCVPSGDYSIVGMIDRVAIERKSKEDLFSTVGQSRDRFIRELMRLNELQSAWVVVEAELSEILSNPPQYSQLNPKSLVRSIDAWQVRFPRVHWWMCPGRDVAEAKTYQLLKRWWMEAGGDSAAGGVDYVI